MAFTPELDLSKVAQGAVNWHIDWGNNADIIDAVIGKIKFTDGSGGTLTAGMVVYLSAVDTVHLANATDATKPAMAVCRTTDGTTAKVKMMGIAKGVVTVGAADIVAGNLIYLSTIAGKVTKTAPTGAGNIRQIIGRAITAESAGKVDIMLAIDYIGTKIVSIINAGVDLIDDNNIAATLMRDSEHAADNHVIPGLTVDTNTLFVDSVNNSVSIGTTAPGAKLYVKGDFLRLEEVAGGRSLDIHPAISGAGHRFTSTTTGVGYQFENNAGELMRITSTGNVGIGTTGLGAKLHIDDEGTLATKVLFQIESDVTTADTIKARIEADGEMFSDIGFTVFSPEVSDDPKIALQEALNEAMKPRKPYTGFVPDENYILEVEKAEKQQEKALKETAKQLLDLDKKIKKEKGEKLEELREQKKELLEIQKQQQAECEKEKKHIANLRKHRALAKKHGVKSLEDEKRLFGKDISLIAIGLAKYCAQLEQRLAKLEARDRDLK